MYKNYYIAATNHKMAPSIPDRWIPYKSCGKVIEGTRFISFKVPLRKTVQQGNEEITEIWDINALLQAVPNLGAVIDLTNTSRYYNPSELQKAGILYKKILMPGRIIPPEKKVNEFMNAVDEFLGKNCESVIGVHCTHGLNRTGYMVCRYMRDRMGIDAKEAVRKFEIARGYKIERSNYIADLIGKKPPPPDLGKNTKVRPIEGTEEVEGHVSSKGAGRYSDKYSSNTRNREIGTWRDICVRDDEDYTIGRYVRHPNSNFCRNERQARNPKHQESNSRYGSNCRTERSNSTDSDKSYDFRYDY